MLGIEQARAPADVAIIGGERQAGQQLRRLAGAGAGATQLVANVAGFTAPEERRRTTDVLGTLAPWRLPGIRMITRRGYPSRPVHLPGGWPSAGSWLS